MNLLGRPGWANLRLEHLDRCVCVWRETWESRVQISARRPAILRGFFVVFLGLSRKMLDSTLKLDQDRFLPYPFQLIIHLSLLHSTLCSLGHQKTTLYKLQTEGGGYTRAQKKIFSTACDSVYSEYWTIAILIWNQRKTVTNIPFTHCLRS
jgi:hypothetical protein